MDKNGTIYWGDTLKNIEVTTETLRFINKIDEEIIVDFKECNKNWIAYHKRNNKWTEEKYEQFRRQSKCVGQRDICAKPPYFEFFTKPFTNVELRNQKEFAALQKMIRDAGWTTFDLS
ncbi:hypothetical protein FE784_17795 [Paenibacillus hemerocallicola]|uniref:Uncharacterized protein n=1 Tax=Paenibacillus hemerocallicola TaxID=1172614 RepID=A0A5C4T706_9BACL|nr:hypothetical protein FE784_17795 [Paenibacillus hemerocallicola]